MKFSKFAKRKQKLNEVPCQDSHLALNKTFSERHKPEGREREREHLQNNNKVKPEQKKNSVRLTHQHGHK
jgi:hypothetical protein